LYAAFGHVSLIYNKHKHSNSIHSDNFLSSPLSFDSFLDATTERIIIIIIRMKNITTARGRLCSGSSSLRSRTLTMVVVHPPGDLAFNRHHQRATATMTTLSLVIERGLHIIYTTPTHIISQRTSSRKYDLRKRPLKSYLQK
jgi:hypothetical protein